AASYVLSSPPVNFSRLQHVCRRGPRLVERSFAHEQSVGHGRDEEAYEPGIVVKPAQRGKEQADQCDDDAQSQSDQCPVVEAARVFIDSAAAVEIDRIERAAADDEVIGDHDSGDWTEKTGIAHQPSEDIALKIREKLPRHHQDADNPGDEAAGAKGNQARVQIGEVVRWRDYVRGNV